MISDELHDEVAAAMRTTLTAEGPLTEPELIDRLLDQGLDLGTDPALTFDSMFLSDDLGLVMPLGDGRYAMLPALLMGRTFTHRLTTAEAAHDLLHITADLEPPSILNEEDPYLQFIDGTEILQVLSRTVDAALLEARGIPLDALGPDPRGNVAWLLEPGTLARHELAAGDLLGLTVHADGFALAKVPEDQVTQLTDFTDRVGETLHLLTQDGRPCDIVGVFWLLCAQDPHLFTSPMLPLGELLAAGDFVVRHDQMGPPGFDFDRWRATTAVESLAREYGLTDTAAFAVRALVAFNDQIADDLRNGVTGTAATLLQDELTALAIPTALEVLLDPLATLALFEETMGVFSRGAAAMVPFTEVLEPLAPRAAVPALLWLRGRAFEQLGRMLDAEASYEAAVALEERSVLSLFDLARIASDRGDAERGLSLLRRAGAQPDDDLVVLLEAFRAQPRPDIGRNDPCWCESGRKYKVCHGRRGPLPLSERAAWLYQKAGQFLADGRSYHEAEDLADIRSQHWAHPDAMEHAMLDPIVADAALFEGDVFEDFLEQRGVLLPADERELAEQWVAARRSVHRLESVTPGEGFTARDLRTDTVVEVRELTASNTVQVGQTYCMRLVPAGDTIQVFGGLEPVAPDQVDALVELLDTEPDAPTLVEFLSRRFAED